MNTPATALPEPRKVSAARGSAWLAEAFGLFGSASGTWILIALILGGIVVVSAFVPGASLIYSLFSYVFSGGLMLGCASLESGQKLELEHLFAAFKAPHLGNLVLLSVLYLALAFVAVFICVIVAVVTVGLSFHSFADAQALTPDQVLPILLIFLLLLAAMIPLMMGIWLAPPLIVLRGLGPVAAFKLSFRACWINFLPFLWYGLLALLLLLAAIVPLLLGLLVMIPVLNCSLYTSYRDIFPQAAPVPAPP